MREGPPLDLVIRQTVAEVVLDSGRQIPATEVRLRREATGGLPSDVSGSGGFTAGQADVTVQPSPPVVRASAPSPLRSPDALMAGRLCSLTVGEESGPRYRVGEMVVRDTSGAATSPSLAVTLSDDLAPLSGTVWSEPLLARMPPVTEGDENLRDVGLWNTAVYARILRAAERHLTPATPNAWIDAPMCGTVWPEVGEVPGAGVHSGSGAAVVGASVTDDGLVHMVGGQVIWRREGAATWNASGVVLDTVQQDAGETSTVLATDAAETAGWQVHLTATSATLRTPDGATTLATLPHTSGRLRVELVGANGAWTIRMASASAGTAEATLPTSPTCDRLIWRSTPKGRLGAVVLAPVADVRTAMASEPSARLHMAYGDLHLLDAMPSIRGLQADTVISAQAAAECARMWQDADNVLHIAGPRWWASRPPVRTLTAEDDLHEWDWSRGLGALPRPVRLDGRTPAIAISPFPDIPLWTAEAMTAGSGRTVKEWIAPGDDEDWLLVDVPFRSPHLPENAWLVNKGRHSLAGGHYTADEGGAAGDIAWSEAGHTLRQVGPASWLWTATWPTTPAGTSLQMAIHPAAAGIAAHLRGSALPVVRGRCKVTWSDGVVHNRPVWTPAGAARGPLLTHAVGWHVQSEAALASLADLIAERAALTLPIVKSIEIAPDWRLEIGDVIEVVDSTTLVQMRCVITEMDVQVGADSGSQTLAVEVLSATALGATYGDVDAAWNPQTYGAAQAGYDGSTYGQVDADPITPAL